MGVYTGTSGTDCLYGSGDNDILIGGDGADIYEFAVGSGTDMVDNVGHGADGDIIRMAALSRPIRYGSTRAATTCK